MLTTTMSDNKIIVKLKPLEISYEKILCYFTLNFTLH